MSELDKEIEFLKIRIKEKKDTVDSASEELIYLEKKMEELEEKKETDPNEIKKEKEEQKRISDFAFEVLSILTKADKDLKKLFAENIDDLYKNGHYYFSQFNTQSQAVECLSRNFKYRKPEDFGEYLFKRDLFDLRGVSQTAHYCKILSREEKK